MAGIDIVLTCRDCGARFGYTEHERELLASEGRHHPPARCVDCREARKRRQAETGSQPVPPGFRELRQTETTIVCSSCGHESVVPFAVRAGRPVYCSPCYRRGAAKVRGA